MTNKMYNHVDTILDIYVTYEGESFRHCTIADFILGKSYYVSSRNRAINFALDEIQWLFDQGYEHVRLYDSYDMDYFDFYK